MVRAALRVREQLPGFREKGEPMTSEQKLAWFEEAADHEGKSFSGYPGKFSW